MADTLVQSNLEKISSFLQDVQYRSLMINSANYNVRLMRERKTRLPFLDSQTGIAQNPCKLYMSARHRMPGTVEGQLYVYPSQRWCRRKRSYMAISHEHWLLKKTIKEPEGDEHTIVTVENPAAVSTEDTNMIYENKSFQETFYYDETAFYEDEEEEPDDDDDDTYSARTTTARKRKKPAKVPKPPKQSSGRGRKKREGAIKPMVEVDEETPGKPYECQLCGARYKTRQGLSYHLSHTHKGGRTNSGGSRTRGASNNSAGTRGETPAAPAGSYQPQAYQPDALAGLTEFQDSYLGYLSAGQDASPTGRSGSSSTSNSSRRSSGGGGVSGGNVTISTGNGSSSSNSRGSKGNSGTWSGLTSVGSPSAMMPGTGNSTGTLEYTRDSSPGRLSVQETEQQYVKSPKPAVEKGKAQPSPYCDFCLGDTLMNKKTGESEELVSCADCGRSGHPTCLQFTAHMMISVRQYRWQCIECKCCTLCGTSENDDQLLFCDDCDRGYHLYCLRPPLQEPPEGEWSCDLCLQQFHTK
ncbi:zinc finger protein DPF3-like isoform X2 [Macrobrachium nipponense]|uniref:zinc finger protein DPF3-like isoform X2 n=1 Tax=Macrobrachium nipponense TaxID=159736 RepID=UPI0030C81195